LPMFITTAQTTHVWKIRKQSRNSDGLFFSKTCSLKFPPLWSRHRCHGSVKRFGSDDMVEEVNKWLQIQSENWWKEGEMPVLLAGASLLKLMEIVWTNKVCDTSLNRYTSTVFTESYNKLLALKYYVAKLLGQTFVLYLLRPVLILLQLQSLKHVFLLSNGPLSTRRNGMTQKTLRLLKIRLLLLHITWSREQARSTWIVVVLLTRLRILHFSNDNKFNRKQLKICVVIYESTTTSFAMSESRGCAVAT
jgi:hypothetical protein